jgi:hypothetical protein
MEVALKVSSRPVATYCVGDPRPYLHPIRTLSGVVVSDCEPEDHTWHLGLSLAMQDVNGTNLWGGRTYVRGQGYTWLDDHGRITHEGFAEQTDERLVQRLTWRDRNDGVLLTERRTIEVSPIDELSYRLSLGWELTAPEKVVMGSPTTNGREYGAGYGGCFLRLAPDPAPLVRAGALQGEEEVNGCAEPEVYWRSPGFAVTLRGAQRWFVRTGIYPGVCAAWAFEQVRVIEAGQTWSDRFEMVVSDLV